MYLAQGHSTMTVVLRLGIEPGTPGFLTVRFNVAEPWIFIKMGRILVSVVRRNQDLAYCRLIYE